MLLHALPCPGEGDVANLLVAADPHAVLDLVKLEDLGVRVVVAFGNEPAAGLRDAAHEALRHLGRRKRAADPGSGYDD